MRLRPSLIILVPLGLFGLAAAAQTYVTCPTASGYRCYWEAEPLTRTPPTTAPVTGTAGAGLSLAGLYGARVSLCPAAGQTLTGAGSLRAYLWHPYASTWMRSPDLDLSVGSATTSANPCRVWPDWLTGVRQNGAVLYATDGVGVSGGTTVTVRIDGQVSP